MSIKRDRVGDSIQAILSELLLREVADPRLKNITVTGVKIDNELMYADVYINALGDESREKEVLTGLERARGFLRREVAKRVRLRGKPKTREDAKKLFDHLLRQGFEFELVSEKVRSLAKSDVED